MEFKFIDTSNPLYQQELALRFELLRKPLGMPQGSEVFPFEEESLHLVAVERGRVMGCVLFWPQGKTGRIFQMAVTEELQGKGVGTGLMRKLEQRLIADSYEDAYLHARGHAVEFYKKLGFSVEGDPFEEVGIEHLKMRKKFK